MRKKKVKRKVVKKHPHKNGAKRKTRKHAVLKKQMAVIGSFLKVFSSPVQ